MKFFGSLLEKVARIITQQYGVQVKFEGDRAYTNGKQIVLPSLPASLTEEIIKDMHGYLDHEAAHCIFTDFQALTGICSDFHHYLTNHCEDVRIEKCMIEKYSGCALHLNPLNYKWHKIALSKWSELSPQHRIALNIRSIMETGKLIKLNPDIKPLFSRKVMRLCLRLPYMVNTAEMVQLCREIIQALDESQQDSRGKGDSNSDEDSEGEDSEGEDSEGEDSEGSVKGQPLDLSSIEQCDIPTSIHELMEREIARIVEKAQESGEYRAYSDVKDTVSAVGDSDPSFFNYAEMRRKNNSIMNKFKIEIENLLVVKERARTIMEQERGQLCTRNLFKLRSDPNYKTPFQSQVKNETKNVSLQLVCDLSGSMFGTKLETLANTLTIVAEALKQIGIEFEIVGFRTALIDGSILPGFSRTEPLEHHIFKSFDSPKLTNIEKLSASGCNCDGESLRFFAQRLSQRKKKRKIMFVFSDGYPNPNSGNPQLRLIWRQDLCNAVREIDKYGIETVAFGIQTDAVKDFYTNYVVVPQTSALTTEVIKKLKEVLR